jgi:hypothetical protein
LELCHHRSALRIREAGLTRLAREFKKELNSRIVLFLLLARIGQTDGLGSFLDPDRVIISHTPANRHSSDLMSMDTAVIRFKCPNCDRYYEVSQVLKHVPLLCKGCGQRIDVPESSSEPEPTALAIPEPIGSPTSQNKSSFIAAAKAALPAIHASEGEDQTTLVAAAESSVAVQMKSDSQADLAGQKAESLPASSIALPHEDDADPSTRKMIGLLLLLVGGLIGEVLVKKSTGDVWREAGSAPKFPPIDLLLWLAPPIMLMLIYYLLITRRKSLGAWLQNRTQS